VTGVPDRKLDLITVGRVSVDLYGQQVGGRLEDMASFAKYVGGCPANIAIGAARLGLSVGFLSRVGDEAMGRFVREQLTREGVDVAHLKTDPTRLTALVILGIRDRENFPLIFYRENCADMALEESDVNESYLASSGAVVVTGTHFSTPNVAAASRRVMGLARSHGGRVVLDIDYRPVLWGLTGHTAGDLRFVSSETVTGHLQSVLPGCDVVVGTEEEIHIAGGSTDTIEALRKIRTITPALIVVKRGPTGAVAFPEAIPDRLEQGVVGPGFVVEVYNVLGAGDGFMAGFLRGYVKDEPLPKALAWGNACGALVVSRHGCAPAIPTWTELRHFLKAGIKTPALRFDPELNHLHWATTRRREHREVCAIAFDHRIQLERLVDKLGQPRQRIAEFKRLVYRAAQAAAGDDPAFGMIVDDRYGRDVLDAETGRGSWLARPIELPEQTPLAFEGGADVGMTLREWPVDQVVKVLVRHQGGDPQPDRSIQEQRLTELFEACRLTEHEILVELIANAAAGPSSDVVAAGMGRLYALGIRPDWWKLMAPADAQGWGKIASMIDANDPFCRGVLLLGLDAPEEELMPSIAAAARQQVCKGFAIGRTIFGEAAEGWLAGRLDDAAAMAEIGRRYTRLIAAWRRARNAAGS
jgi:5-dehydro-2-deoxygluconokinase